MKAALPAGYRGLWFDSIDSTNAEALRHAAFGADGGLWVVAQEQNLGRGRSGRYWQSPPGNLYASLLLRPRCSAADAAGLSLLFAVAAHDAIVAVTGGWITTPQLALKWPNDILAGDCKLGGILLESTGTAGHPDFALVAGLGVNVAVSPGLSDRAVTHLHAYDPVVDTDALFAGLAETSAAWLDVWQDGKNFAAIRSAWLARAYGLGQAIRVHVGDSPITGIFLGVDEGGALRLGRADGAGERRITAGDVVFAPATV